MVGIALSLLLLCCIPDPWKGKRRRVRRGASLKCALWFRGPPSFFLLALLAHPHREGERGEERKEERGRGEAEGTGRHNVISSYCFFSYEAKVPVA